MSSAMTRDRSEGASCREGRHVEVAAAGWLCDRRVRRTWRRCERVGSRMGEREQLCEVPVARATRPPVPLAAVNRSCVTRLWPVLLEMNTTMNAIATEDEQETDPATQHEKEVDMYETVHIKKHERG